MPPTNTLARSPDYTSAIGLDVRYRASSASVLNLTVNPDFGQVEVDPAVVNLTAFETFFPEKRPFFVEGQSAFAFGDVRAYNPPLPPPIAFFSRRIGRAPELAPTEYEFVDVPAATRIIAAAKLTGRTGSGVSFGLLDAYTARENASYLDGGKLGSQVAEPPTNYLVLRGTREMAAGLVRTGAFLSAVNRATGDSTVASQLRSSAYVGGFDLATDFDNRVWLFDLSATGSVVSGTPEVIARTQRSVTHYFQRPDHRSVRLDSTRTTLSGDLLRAAITKGSGSWLGSAAVEQWSPGLELNDLGFQLRSARRALATDIHYFQSRRRGGFQWWTLGWMETHVWNYDADRVYNRHALLGDAEFTNASRVDMNLELRLPVMYEFLTRGGPLTEAPRTLRIELGYSTDRRKPYQLSPRAVVTNGATGDHEISGQLGISVTPASNLTLQVTPAYRSYRGVSELLATRPSGNAETYGIWYDFGMLHRSEASLETRLNWTPSPRLSMQFYVQPLISSGIYSQYLSLRRARSYDFVSYGGPPLDADFDVGSLRGNAVLRWEYARGSVAYLVWQQERNGSDAAPAELRLGRDTGELLGLPPHNIFSVKVAHWIGR